MRRISFALVLGLAACATQEAGRSPYINEPFVASAEQQAIFDARRAEADRILAATVAGQDERRTLAGAPPGGSVFSDPQPLGTTAPVMVRGDDAALVASLEAAIEGAGGGATGGATPAQPAMPSLAEAGTVIEPAASARNVTLSERQIETADAGAAEADGAVITDNSFASVTQRESIESDAERLAALSRERVVVEAEPLPTPTTSANLAAFARATQHRIGQRVYPRGSSRSTSAAARTCRSYGNSDEAQRAFLAAGGPDKDALNLDPDGDGFVCGWSPEPFRALRAGNG